MGRWERCWDIIALEMQVRELRVRYFISRGLFRRQADIDGVVVSARELRAQFPRSSFLIVLQIRSGRNRATSSHC